MKLNDLDRRVLGALLRSEKQSEIARNTRATQSAVTHSLLKLERGGFVDLSRNGQRHDAKLSVLTALDRLEESVRAILRCTLDPSLDPA